METTHQKPISHSATVQIQLAVNGIILPVSQLGPSFLILKDAIDYPPIDAESTILIDGNDEGWRVHLPEGISSAKRKTAIAKCPARNGSATP